MDRKRRRLISHLWLKAVALFFFLVVLLPPSTAQCFPKMSAFRICLSAPPPLNQNAAPKVPRALQFSKTHLANSGNKLIEAPLQCPISNRRILTMSILGLTLPISFPVARAEQELELQEYVDSKEGFSLLIPSSYARVDKAGATVLFEEVNKGVNNVGVVVTPVRLTSLKNFGTPDFVADKLIQAEKRKESTKSTELIGAGERSGKGGLDVYEFEYKVDSTRGGMKRVFSAAMVSQKKLYLLNIVHADKPDSPLDEQTKSILETVLHSFDVVLP